MKKIRLVGRFKVSSEGEKPVKEGRKKIRDVLGGLDKKGFD